MKSFFHPIIITEQEKEQLAFLKKSFEDKNNFGEKDWIRCLKSCSDNAHTTDLKFIIKNYSRFKFYNQCLWKNKQIMMERGSLTVEKKFFADQLFNKIEGEIKRYRK